MRGFPKGYRYEHQGVRPTKATCNDGSVVRSQRLIIIRKGGSIVCTRTPMGIGLTAIGDCDVTYWDWQKERR